MTEFKREDPRHGKGALVEIVEVFPGRHYDQAKVDEVPVIKAHRVYVNGTPVGLITRDDGITLEIDPREDDATILTLRLMPRQVMVRGVVETPEQTVFDGPVDLTETDFQPIGEPVDLLAKMAPAPTADEPSDG